MSLRGNVTMTNAYCANVTVPFVILEYIFENSHIIKEIFDKL